MASETTKALETLLSYADHDNLLVKDGRAIRSAVVLLRNELDRLDRTIKEKDLELNYLKLGPEAKLQGVITTQDKQMLELIKTIAMAISMQSGKSFTWDLKE